MGQPTLIAIAYTIERNKKAYYTAIELANRRNEITPWLYFADLVLNAQGYTATWIEFLISKAKLYDRLRGQLNPRQEKVLGQAIPVKARDFGGRFECGKIHSHYRSAGATATRDLQDLVGKGALLGVVNVSIRVIY